MAGTTSLTVLSTVSNKALRGALRISVDSSELFINNIKGQYPDISISFTGHSLGAVFAEISACRYRCEAVTFESPGSRHIVDSDRRCNGYDKNSITCYLTAPNAINTSNEQIAGDLRRIYIPHTDGLNAWHAAKCLWGTANRMWTYASLGSSVASFFASNVSKTTVNGASISADYIYISDEGIKLLGKTVEISGGSISTPALEIIAENVIVTGTIISSSELIASNALYNVIKAKIFSLVTSKIALQVVNTAEWCIKQHSIDNILNQFIPSTGEAIKYTVVRSWPKLTAKTFFSTNTVKGIFYNLLPARPYNRGLHRLFSENEVIEAQIAMINGYEIDEDEVNNNYLNRP